MAIEGAARDLASPEKVSSAHVCSGKAQSVKTEAQLPDLRRALSEA